MAVSDLVNLSALMDDAKCFAMVLDFARSHRSELVVVVVVAVRHGA